MTILFSCFNIQGSGINSVYNHTWFVSSENQIQAFVPATHTFPTELHPLPHFSDISIQYIPSSVVSSLIIKINNKLDKKGLN